VTRLAAALADRYRLERELDQGGMATGYLAEDLTHQRKAAIEELHPRRSAVSCTLGPRLPGGAATTDIQP
jgi:serine/threonine-protein kinase